MNNIEKIRMCAGDQVLRDGDALRQEASSGVLEEVADEAFWLRQAVDDGRLVSLAASRPCDVRSAMLECVLEFLRLLLTTLVASVRPRHDLVFENLLLRHQLAVLARPTRTWPRPRLHLWDKLLWILARRFFAG